MNECPLVWIIMGVAGSGKTSVGRRLSERLECDFLEGDRRHPPANIAKMMAQTPLQDADRQQWLLTLAADIHRAVSHHRETVLTCSGLKAAYRQPLTAPGRVQLVWLEVPRSELERRLAQRANHFMQPAMLASQLAASEPMGPDEAVIKVNGMRALDDIVDDLLNQAAARFPSLKDPWWCRSGE
jgi:gluconokinase